MVSTGFEVLMPGSVAAQFRKTIALSTAVWQITVLNHRVNRVKEIHHTLASVDMHG
jgi:hypothetical protein